MYTPVRISCMNCNLYAYSDAQINLDKMSLMAESVITSVCLYVSQEYCEEADPSVNFPS